jgi:hypothetical protein
VGADLGQRAIGVTVMVKARTEKAAQEIATRALLDEMVKLGLIGDESGRPGARSQGWHTLARRGADNSPRVGVESQPRPRTAVGHTAGGEGTVGGRVLHRGLPGRGGEPLGLRRRV